jgi:multiple sugar transport system permease protein
MYFHGPGNMAESSVFDRLRCGIFALLALGCLVYRCEAGRVETRPDGETVIHISVYALPDPTRTDPATRAQVAGDNEFKRRFAEIFAERYREKYEADPARYGKRNWRKVSVQLDEFLGLDVQGVEIDSMAIAGGIPADVLFVNFRKSDHYIQNGFLHPLDLPDDDYVTAIAQSELNARIHPKIWPVLRRRGSNGATHVWAMPKGGALGMVLLFRKDIFDARGVEYPTSQWTWDDLHRACQKLSDPAAGLYALVGALGPSESWYWFQYLWAAGAEVMEQDPVSGEWRCTFDSRAAARSLDFYTLLNTERWIDSQGRPCRGYTRRDVNARDAWKRGEVAMCLDYLNGNLLTELNPELVGIVPTPMVPDGTRGCELNSEMLGLSSQIKDPAVRDAAWEYIRFYDSPEAQRVRTRVLVDGGMGPLVNPEHLRKYGYPEVEQLAPKELLETYQTAIASGRPEPYGPNASYVYQVATNPLRQVEELAMSDALPADREARLDVIQEILRRGVARADEEMLGRVPPSERRKRDLTAWAVLLSAILLAFVLFRKVVATFDERGQESLSSDASKIRRRAWRLAFVLLIPAVLTILAWQYLPLLRGSAMAFQDYKLQGNSSWVGVKNFGDLLYDSYWWQSVWNALRYSFLIVALTFLPPIALAILLQEVPVGSLLFRVIFYLPAVLSGLVTVLLWKQFYAASERGVLNMVVMRIPAIAYLLVGAIILWMSIAFARRLWKHGGTTAGTLVVFAGLVILSTLFSWASPILFPVGQNWALAFTRIFDTPREPFRWLSDPDTAMLACVIPLVWASVGPGCLIYLAALRGISDDYYEAADLDGADLFDKILFIVFPILRPLILINFTGVFIASWYGSEANILTMTAGAGNTEVAGLHIFYKAFQGMQFGPATAMAWVLAFMLMGFTVYQLRLIGRVEFRTTGEK